MYWSETPGVSSTLARSSAVMGMGITFAAARGDLLLRCGDDRQAAALHLLGQLGRLFCRLRVLPFAGVEMRPRRPQFFKHLGNVRLAVLVAPSHLLGDRPQ